MLYARNSSFSALEINFRQAVEGAKTAGHVSRLALKSYTRPTAWLTRIAFITLEHSVDSDYKGVCLSVYPVAAVS